MESIYRACTLCEAQCGLAFDIDGGRIVAVRGDDEDVSSRGFVCPKGIANAELLYDPDRLRGPVRRTASGEFEPIGWDEAFALARDLLQGVRARHGRNSLAAFFGSPVVHSPSSLIAEAGLGLAIGRENIYGTSSQDTSPRFATSYLLYGSSVRVPLPDLDRTQFLLCIGANPVVSNGSFLTAPNMRARLRAIRARGGKVVVVDPRHSETARESDEHVAILPGGDAALLLGMIHVLIHEGRVDRAAVEGARGWAVVEPLVRALPLERLASACGLASQTIARLAREFAQAESSVAYSRVGVCNNRFGTLGTYATDLLNLAAGRLGVLGGALFARPALDGARLFGQPGVDGYGRFRSRVRKLPETVGQLPGACLAEEIETAGKDQVRGLVTLAANPVLSVPNGARLGRALASLQAMVAIDPYINETTRHAHVILPPASTLSEEHLDFFFTNFSVRNVTRVLPPVVSPEQGQPQEWEIMRRLAEGLGGGLTSASAVNAVLRGLRAVGVDVTPLDILDAFLRSGPNGDHFLPWSRGWNLKKLRSVPRGVDLGPLEPGIRDRILHRDRRVHVDATPLVGALREFAADIPAGLRDGELLLIGRRELRSKNSWMHNVPSLVSGRARCVLLIHPADAQSRGLEDGGQAWLESRVHQGAVPIRFSEDLRRGVISLPHGYGHGSVARFQKTAATRAGVSFNDWSDDSVVESVVGQSILNGVPVRLGPVPSTATLASGAAATN